MSGKKIEHWSLVGMAIALCLASPSRGAEGLSKNSVMDAMKPYIKAFRNCTDEQHRLDPTVTGSVEISFTIGNDGRVTEVGVNTEGYQKTFVSGCITAVFLSMRFPKFSGPPVVIPGFPVRLRDANQDGLSDLLSSAVRKPSRKETAGMLRALRPHAKEMRACIQNLGEKNTPFRSRLLISFTVDLEGRITKFEVLDPKYRKSYVAGCIAGVMVVIGIPKFQKAPIAFSRIKLPGW